MIAQEQYKILDSKLDAINSKVSTFDSRIEALEIRLARSEKRNASANENRAWNAGIILLLVIGYFVHKGDLKFDQAAGALTTLGVALYGFVALAQQRQKKKDSIPPPSSQE
jgi:hypothetical protein